MALKLVEGWVLGGYTAASSCIETPGPLKDAWGKGNVERLEALALEFAFPMMSRWFRYISGASSGPPGYRFQVREAWTRYVISCLWDVGVEKRLAIRMRLDSLFNNDCEANIEAGASPSALGLVPYNSLSPAEAAGVTENYLRDLGAPDELFKTLGMQVGGVSVSEPYVLGMRALGLCGRLQRINPQWDEVASTTMRPPTVRTAGRQVPPRVWSLSAALLVVPHLDAGMTTMFRRLQDFPVLQNRFAPAFGPHLQ